MRVLLVEDDQHQAEHIIEQLVSAGVCSRGDVLHVKTELAFERAIEDGLIRRFGATICIVDLMVNTRLPDDFVGRGSSRMDPAIPPAPRRDPYTAGHRISAKLSDEGYGGRILLYTIISESDALESTSADDAAVVPFRYVDKKKAGELLRRVRDLVRSQNE